MKIVYIATGAAGMYCGTCLHDNTLAAALKKRGHDLTLIPTYTPMRTDEKDVSINRVFYGGINAYLEQKFSFFRNSPRWVDWIFNRPVLLNLLSKLSSSTDARELGALTVSVLEGEKGHQKKELEKLVEWLRLDPPDIIILNNSMFLGMVPTLKREFGVPVVCGLQGEDIFLEDLPDPFRTEAAKLQKQNAGLIDMFIAPSRYYANKMKDYLEVSADRFTVIPLGINLDGYGAEPQPTGDTFTIGYLARICPEKGLHVLVDAFRELTNLVGSKRVRLKVAGYLGRKDVPYKKQQVQKIDSWGLTDRFEFVGEVTREEKTSFLSGLDIFCVPTVYKEPKGIFAIEAQAAGVPMVLPDHGAFPELMEMTGGGLLVEPNNPGKIAEGIARLMADETRRKELGRAGRKKAVELLGDATMAETTEKILRSLVGQKTGLAAGK